MSARIESSLNRLKVPAATAERRTASGKKAVSPVESRKWRSTMVKFSSLVLGFSVLSLQSSAQDFYKTTRAGWLKIAEQNKPVLKEQVNYPKEIVALVNDKESFQSWKATRSAAINSLYQSSFKNQSGIVVDFGKHMTGYYTFTIKALHSIPDAPLRFKLTFGEVPAELATPFDPYTGALSRAWLQDETVTVMTLPATITIPRRLAFRYLKIDLLGSSPYFDFKIEEMHCKASTSVTAFPPALAPGTDALITKIDRTGLETLKECMQTVYEDGPKRDRRLWIGDLYLESLSNMYSFKNFSLTKRCLYLLAGLSEPNGYLCSNIFETPTPHAQEGSQFLLDYALLYNVALKEYLVASGDRQTALDLWPVAKKQISSFSQFLKTDGIFDNQAAEKAGWWLFVDWKDGLDREAALQGIIIFSLKRTMELAKLLGKEKEVAEFPSLIQKMTEAARQQLLDKETGLFVSGAKKQVSYASQAWMVLSGVATQPEAQKALTAVKERKDAVKPGAPYLYHYYIESLVQSGMPEVAKQELTTYWGGMVNKGADTFWEVYDPTNELLSPYNCYPVNSYCHAWSCTPVYFIRKYPEIFQNQPKSTKGQTSYQGKRGTTAIAAQK